MSLQIEILTEQHRFRAVRADWQRLWELGGGFVFQHHSWIDGWLSGMAGRREVKLRIALAWDGARLCGAMPCAVHRRSGLRILMWAAQAFSDYCDCLLDPNYEADPVLALLWDGVQRSGGFDLINLQQIRPDAKCRGFLEDRTHADKGLQFGGQGERCMRIENRWPDGAAFFRSLNKKGRNNHVRGKRILCELGGDVGFRSMGGNEDGGPVLDEIMRLKDAWLRANDPSSGLLGCDRIAFRTLIDMVWKAGLAKIFLLECGGKIAAASINFVYSGRMEAYFTAYDTRFERASPGTVLMVDYASWAFDRGLVHVDFLRGEEAFKFRMANAETVLGSFAGARTILGRVAVFGHGWLGRRRREGGSGHGGAGLRGEDGSALAAM